MMNPTNLSIKVPKFQHDQPQAINHRMSEMRIEKKKQSIPLKAKGAENVLSSVLVGSERLRQRKRGERDRGRRSVRRGRR